LKLSRTKSTAAAESPLLGRRVLALGQSLAPLAKGPLAGASLEMGAMADLAISAAVADLIIIDADAWEAPALAAAVKTLGALKACPPVLLVGEHLPAGLVRNLMRLTAADILESPFTAEQFTAAARTLLADFAPAPLITAPGESRCWAVAGAVGGAGATTAAIEIAYALSQRARDERGVCLIDLNLADGAAAAYLGATPAMRLAEFSHAADRLDAAMLRAFVTPISKRLDLLAGVRDPGAFDEVGREAVLRMLEVACECYDWVILDLPRHRRSWTLEALSGCDEVMVISELTVPALLAARAYSDEIEGALQRRPRIVLNRVAGGRLFGPAPSLAEAEKALQRKAEAGLSSDWEAAAASVNLGGPIAQHRPKSKIVKDIHALVDRLIAQPARRDAAVEAA
jgi:pilus assembly protein CpaE